MAKWLAARRANYPTKARVAQKKEAGLLSTPAANANDSKEVTTAPVDPVEKEADRLRKRLAKLDRKLEKRKRAPNDEGDEMRSESSDDESDDEKPESLPTDKSATGFLPPPPLPELIPQTTANTIQPVAFAERRASAVLFTTLLLERLPFKRGPETGAE